jgi:hypothetical protein
MALTASSPEASLRRPCIAAARGCVLAIHAAVGMAGSVDRDAVRLLRACEGLARTAVACLEVAGRRPVSSPAEKEKKEKNKEVLKGKGKGKGKEKEKKEKNKVEKNKEVSLGDEWADGLSAPSAGAAVVVRGGPPVRPPRVLVARRSSSRSPRRGGDPQPPDSAPPPLVVGQLATIKALAQRPELDSRYVRLLEFDAAAERWACELRSGERLRIKPDKLLSIKPERLILAQYDFEQEVGGGVPSTTT